MANWRQRLVNWLLGAAPAGGVVSPPDYTIDDGFDYALPVEVPAALGEPGNEKALAEWVGRLAASDPGYQKLLETTTEYQMPFDTPYGTSKWENMTQYPFAIPLREWDWSTRRRIIERSHLAYERNPLAKRAVKINTQFSIGEGLAITYRNDKVKELLEAFRANKENAVDSFEKELCNDLQLDGEVMIRFFDNSDGDTVIVPLRPWEIAWIECDPQFIRRVKSYHRQGYLSNGIPGNYQPIIDDIDAADVLHVAINRASYEQRGRPELFAILPWLRAYKDWVENRARQNQYRGAVFMDITLTGGTPGQVATKRAQYKIPPPPGSLYIHNDKEAMQMVESKVGANDVAEDGRQIKLMNAVGMGQPEYMLSDGQNANLASASAQQLPALRSFQDYQDINVNQLWRPIYEHVIQNAIDAGTLPETVQEMDSDGNVIEGDDGKPQMIKALEAFDVAAPELETDDPFNLAQALQIQQANEWISKETASTKAGNDYRIEQRKMDSEQEAADAKLIDRRAQGLAPGPLPVTVPPEPGSNGAKPPQGVPVNAAAVAGNGQQDGLPRTARSSGRIPGGDDGTKGISKPGFPAESDHTNDAHTTLTPFAIHLHDAVPAEFKERIINLTNAMQDSVTRTDAISGQIQKIKLDMRALSEAADEKDRQQLAAIHELLNAMEAASDYAPADINIDADMVRRIAAESAQAVVAASQVVANEITSRDGQGRALEVTRALADGTILVYRIKRDDQGSILGLEKQ